jgi:flagellar basal-body rod protein FlgG
MERGIYSAATGMLAQQFVLDAVASNIANANTTGFKQDIPTFRALHEMNLNRFSGAGQTQTSAVGRVGTGVTFDAAVIDLSQGVLRPTGNPLDVAITGDGYFAVQTPQGERYTRDGHFQMEPDARGADGKAAAYLATGSGQRVLGLKGPIVVPEDGDIRIQPDGRVLVNGVEVDRLKVVRPVDGMPVKEGGNLVALRGQTEAASARLATGTLEASNVNPVRAMVQMIVVQRAYESAQRAVTAHDETLGKVINEAGKV